MPRFVYVIPGSRGYPGTRYPGYLREGISTEFVLAHRPWTATPGSHTRAGRSRTQCQQFSAPGEFLPRAGEDGLRQKQDSRQFPTNDFTFRQGTNIQESRTVLPVVLWQYRVPGCTVTVNQRDARDAAVLSE
eukprot:687507-Rhodomonas_salina.2